MFSDGKVAIVTGGTRGIGGAITRMLAQAGIKVAAGYSRGKDGAEKLKAELKRQLARLDSSRQRALA